MRRSQFQLNSLLPEHRALQHEHAPRPLPLFLDLVRAAAERDPAIARGALDGLAAYRDAPRTAPARPRPQVAEVGSASLRDHGGSGPPLLVVPSLINPPHILDLDGEVSLTDALAGMGRHVLLLDWGEARGRAELSVAGHVEHLLLPMLRSIGTPPALLGYCLGGTMAIAAANLAPVERVLTLAAPWRFAAYPPASRDAVQAIWRNARGAAVQLGALPMEVLQAAFWSLDPDRTVAKFARFAEGATGSPAARRFVQLEDWANRGEPLPCPAARELIEDFFGADRPGRGEWSVGGRAVSDCLAVPVLHCTAGRDRIAPAGTAAAGATVAIDAGHVGMVVGSARAQLHRALASALAAPAPSR